MIYNARYLFSSWLGKVPIETWGVSLETCQLVLRNIPTSIDPGGLPVTRLHQSIHPWLWLWLSCLVRY